MKRHPRPAAAIPRDVLVRLLGRIAAWALRPGQRPLPLAVRVRAPQHRGR